MHKHPSPAQGALRTGNSLGKTLKKRSSSWWRAFCKHRIVGWGKIGDWLPFAFAKVQKLSLLTNVCSAKFQKEPAEGGGNFAKAFLNLNKRNLLPGVHGAHVQLTDSFSSPVWGNFSNAINFCTQRGGRSRNVGVDMAMGMGMGVARTFLRLGKSFWRRRSLCFSHPSWHNAQISVAAACGILPRPSFYVLPE